MISDFLNIKSEDDFRNFGIFEENVKSLEEVLLEDQ